MTDLKTLITESARKFGADLVGFASIDRFTDIPSMQHPASIYPDCKTVIGLGFRVLRGSLRGVEEGTTYYQYTTMGIELLEENYMPRSMMRLCGVIEDAGFTAAPQKRYQLIRSDADATNPEMNYKKIYHNVNMPQLDFAKTAVVCGLGEMGCSGQVLTDDFGPFQRFCFILTDAEIESSPLIPKHLCDNCGECAKACPGKAMEPSDEGFTTDSWQCAAYLAGANASKNPFLAPDALSGLADRMAILRGEKKLTPDEAKEVMNALHFYPPMKHAYATNVCGRACDRACYDHLEKTGKLARKFANPFRRGEDWVLPLDEFDRK